MRKGRSLACSSACSVTGWCGSSRLKSPGSGGMSLGFFVAFLVGVVVALDRWDTKDLTGLVWYRGVDREFDYEVNWPARYKIMVAIQWR